MNLNLAADHHPNNLNGHAPGASRENLSRAASRSSARSRNSTLSRNQSLIKKNIELHDLKPADVLIERFVAWKAIVKQLIAYFEGIADIENNTAKELTKLAGVIQVPFRSGNQFLGEGGLQDVYYNIRDKTRVIADQHADLGRTIDSSIVQHLQKLRVEVKAHIRNVQNDTGKLAAGVARERELSTKLVGELSNNVSTFKNTPMKLQPRQDPFVCNQAVARQLQRQVLEENLLQKSIVIMQQNSAHFEEGIVRSIQSAWQTFDEWQSRASMSSQDIFRTLSAHVASMKPDLEWIQFSARSDHLLDPDTPLRDPEQINYPLKDDASVVPVHTGHLGRKQRFTRAYTEAYFVLTPAGFLHEFATGDSSTAAGQIPTFSLFLPSCTLGPPSPPSAKAHKFLIQGRKDGLGTTKTGSLKALLGADNAKAWSFRARSQEEMMEWWNDIRMLCARYLIASEHMDRTGPVEAAVRSAGYLNPEDESEGEEEEEEEGVIDDRRERVLVREVHRNGDREREREREEGSSVEEEVDEGADADIYAGAPPGYTHPEKHYPIEIGPNGYVIDKKPAMSGHYLSAVHHPAPPPVEGGAMYNAVQTGRPVFHPAGREAVHAPERHVNNFVWGDSGMTNHRDAAPGVDTAGGEGERRVERRLSRRQMEKAPEGRLHDNDEEAGAGVDAERESPWGGEAPPPPITSQVQQRLHEGQDQPSEMNSTVPAIPPITSTRGQGNENGGVHSPPSSPAPGPVHTQGPTQTQTEGEAVEIEDDDEDGDRDGDDEGGEGEVEE